MSRLGYQGAIDVSENAYTTSHCHGFSIYVPSNAAGNIVATPFGNSSPVTFSDYSPGEFLRAGARFKNVTTDTAATGLEAWW